MEQILQDIAINIKDLAQPNSAENYMVTIAIISAILSGMALLATVFIFVRQKNILSRQVELSEKQAQIMEQQNKIALFEQRYAAYSGFVDLYTYGLKCLANASNDGILFEEKHKEYDSRTLSYLYNDTIHSKCYKLLTSVLELNKNKEIQKVGIDPCTLPWRPNVEHIKDLSKDIDFFNLCEEMQNYLKL